MKERTDRVEGYFYICIVFACVTTGTGNPFLGMAALSSLLAIFKFIGAAQEKTIKELMKLKEELTKLKGEPSST